MPVFNFDLEDGKPPVTFNLKPEDAARFMGFMAQCEGDQKDAARYRWLRATTNYVTSKGQRIELTVPEELDAAIDSCIADDGVLGTGSAAGHSTAEFSNLSNQCHAFGVRESDR